MIGGSLSAGLDVKLDRDVTIEELAVGRYVVARGPRDRFLLHDHRRGAGQRQPDDHQAAAGLSRPAPGARSIGARPPSAQCISARCSSLMKRSGEAQAGQDRARAFHAGQHGQPGRGGYRLRRGGPATGGRTRRTLLPHRRAAGHGGVKITLNLERLVERSSGVFGKSGTGKTFLSRLLLAGIIRDRRRRQPDLRHAQRVRLGGQRRGR